jgi:DNA-binding response OmpR family regulator
MVLSERYHLFMAETGRRTLELASEIEPDVILLDWTLPDAEGDEIIGQLRTRGPALKAVPIVIVSGSNAVVAIAERVGAVPCPKPCDVDQLVGAIERALAMRGSSRSSS